MGKQVTQGRQEITILKGLEEEMERFCLRGSLIDAGYFKSFSYLICGVWCLLASSVSHLSPFGGKVVYKYCNK